MSLKALINMKTRKLLAVALGLVLGVSFFSCQKTITPPSKKPPVVTAGPSQTISLPTDSVTLSGYATDSSSTIVAYLWSQVSGPQAALIENDGSKTTVVTGFVPGTYIFQLEATDTFGLTGVDTMEVIMTGPSKNTNPVLFAPVHNPFELEMIGSSSDNLAVGQNPSELGAETWTINSTQVEVRSLFQFDLSSLSNTSIAKAQLSLYSDPTPGTGNLSTPNAGTANQFYIQRVNSSWNAASVPFWSSQPTVDTTDEVLIPSTNASTLDLPNIDVTQLVKDMLANGNYGFEIRLQYEQIYNSRIFCSSNYSDTTKIPTLYITY
jgi:hypothetical protein